MFDPHRTRRNDRRFYTRKGQVIQAKNLNSPFTIEQNKVDAYKEYIIKNRLYVPPTPPPVPITLHRLHVYYGSGGANAETFFSQFDVAASGYTTTFQPGTALIIYITQSESGWDVNFYVVSASSYTFSEPGWYDVISFGSNNPGTFTIYFEDASNQRYFDISLISDTQYAQAAAVVGLSRSSYILPLPALSE